MLQKKTTLSSLNFCCIKNCFTHSCCCSTRLFLPRRFLFDAVTIKRPTSAFCGWQRRPFKILNRPTAPAAGIHLSWAGFRLSLAWAQVYLNVCKNFIDNPIQKRIPSSPRPCVCAVPAFIAGSFAAHWAGHILRYCDSLQSVILE